jgi:hypothetical protein
MARRARAVLVVAALAVVLAAGVWAGRAWLPPWLPQRVESPPQAAPASPAGEPGPTETRKIQATLFYVSGDGMRLAAVQRDIPFGEGAAEQARQIMLELLQPAPSPYASAIPRGTRLRQVFLSGRGEAFVDLSREVSTGHVGGSLTEAFTVYAIVNTLTANLPAVTGVQILVEGQEADTLAGHIDIRHPLRKNLRWVQKPESP